MGEPTRSQGTRRLVLRGRRRNEESWDCTTIRARGPWLIKSAPWHRTLPRGGSGRPRMPSQAKKPVWGVCRSVHVVGELARMISTCFDVRTKASQCSDDRQQQSHSRRPALERADARCTRVTTSKGRRETRSLRVAFRHLQDRPCGTLFFSKFDFFIGEIFRLSENRKFLIFFLCLNITQGL